MPVPEIISITGDSGVLEGRDVVLNCEASSRDGDVSIVWSGPSSGGNETVTALPDAVETMVNSTLTSSITLASIDSSFSGTYTCNATNRLTSVSSTTTLSVISKSSSALVPMHHHSFCHQ